MSERDITGHCTTTCQLHDDTKDKIDKLDNTIFGTDDRGGLVSTVQRIWDTVETIKKAVYGLIGLICLTVFVAVIKMVLKGA